MVKNIGGGFAGFFGLILFILNEVAKIAKELPDPKQFIVGRQISQSTKIYDRSGEVLLYEIYDKEKELLFLLRKFPITSNMPPWRLKIKIFTTIRPLTGGR